MNNHGKNEDLKDPYTFDSQDENDGENFQVFTPVNILPKIGTFARDCVRSANFLPTKFWMAIFDSF